MNILAPSCRGTIPYKNRQPRVSRELLHAHFGLPLFVLLQLFPQELRIPANAGKISYSEYTPIGECLRRYKVDGICALVKTR